MTLGTSPKPEGLTNPPLHELMEHADSKYALLIFGAKRAKQINNYFIQLKEGNIQEVGPLTPYANNEQPLSIAFREINKDLIEGKLGSEDSVSSQSRSKVMSDSISLSATDLMGEGEEEDDDIDGEEDEAAEAEEPYGEEEDDVIEEEDDEGEGEEDIDE
ncbi:MAG: DNA-directed RNA polymerase subunit omega [Aeriscardovia sp.]|nr:DNA-directed RNA polymerase subunit omega [Aeriscardovia sp.]